MSMTSAFALSNLRLFIRVFFVLRCKLVLDNQIPAKVIKTLFFMLIV